MHIQYYFPTTSKIPESPVLRKYVLLKSNTLSHITFYKTDNLFKIPCVRFIHNYDYS